MKRGRKKGFRLSEEMKNNREKITKKNVTALKRFIIESYDMQTLKLLRKSFVGRRGKELNLYRKVLRRLADQGYTYNEIGIVIGKTRELVGFFCKNR